MMSLNATSGKSFKSTLDILSRLALNWERVLLMMKLSVWLTLYPSITFCSTFSINVINLTLCIAEAAVKYCVLIIGIDYLSHYTLASQCHVEYFFVFISFFTLMQKRRERMSRKKRSENVKEWCERTFWRGRKKFYIYIKIATHIHTLTSGRKIDFKKRKMPTWEWRVEAREREKRKREKVWLLTFVCCCRSSNEWLPISFLRFLHLTVWRTERHRQIICRLLLVDSSTLFRRTHYHHSNGRCVWKHCARNGQPSKMKVRTGVEELRNDRAWYSGAVISGSRMDLSNNELKPMRYRSNNSFVLPTSLSNDLSSLHMTPSDSNEELDMNHLQQTSVNPMFTPPIVSPPNANQSSAYQAIEAAYLEHGIRIHLNPATASTMTQQQPSTTDPVNGNKPPMNPQRPRVFIHRNPSRSSSALLYTNAVPDDNRDSRPFSALHQTSNHQFEQYRSDDVSYRPMVDLSQLPAQSTVDYSSTSMLASEHSNVVSPTANLGMHTIVTRSVENDADLDYMTRLLKTANGDSFRGKALRTETF